MRKKNRKIKKRLSYTQIIILSFLAVILLGAGLLTLPISSATHEWTDITTALFTATSATCVTGLIVVETGAYWSLFGQIVILVLIQIGGLGIMTLLSIILLFLSNNASLRNRTMAMQSSGIITYSDVRSTLSKVLIGTFAFEFLGTIVLSIRFIGDYGILKGVWFAIFHSVSAFCNAGFDIFGTGKSLIDYNLDPLVLITIACLIVIGGIGFFVWNDISKHKLRFKKYSLHSKLALTTTFLLITLGSCLFYVTEQNNALQEFSTGNKILNAIFQSVTLRTAGFASVDQASLSGGGTILSYFFMFIGGTTGSTAGGIKTTTFAVLVLTFLASIKRKTEVGAYKRRLTETTVRNAFNIAFIYIMAIVVASVAICTIDGISAQKVVFEVISAIGTVGLSQGVTSLLSMASRYVIIALMFVGRIGGFTFILAFSKPKSSNLTERPNEDIMIG